ncbi:MAG: hypothetical protein QGI10_14900 [Vicinamibacterales bacterium]|jgi:hypothetical protein|nr:hypothetical protein [Vicinamibacterales bacterium]MDP7480549.1 hypothetical protein [Vicinamibacterales bacterium]MDP7693019.1 hypothetical protein [Vicinamibacterales bacterium]HJN44282.1 hypothetical protein [Vicinamibacterales bacterium]
MRETLGTGLLVAMCLVVGMLLWLTGDATAGADGVTGYDSQASWHNAGGTGMSSQNVRFQYRPQSPAE